MGNQRLNLSILVALLIVIEILLSAVAFGQTFGRIKLVVKTPDGAPVHGARITATCHDLGKFKKELKTNKRGEAILSVIDATKLYQAMIEHDDYPTIEMDVKAQLGGTTTQEITLANAPPPPTTSRKGTLTPAQSIFNEGVKAAQEGDFTTAKGKFLESLELDQDLAQAHLALASLYFDDKDYALTIQYANRASNLQPDSIRAYRLLYEAYSATGNKKEARQAIDRLNELGGGSDTAAVIYNEGVAALQIGDTETAKENFEKALESQGDLLPALSALAIVYYNEKNYSKSAELSERFLEKDGSDNRMLRVRWESYRLLGDSVKEKEAFEYVVANDPQVLVRELFDTGAKQFENGETDAAQESFEKVLEIDPKHARSHYQLGLCLVNKGDKVRAREHLEEFISIAPDDPETEVAKEMLKFIQG